MCTEKSRRYLTSGQGNWYGHYNTGDCIDIRWYYYLDKGQYYYLDNIQYKLLGGAKYSLGQQFGCRDIISLNWLDFYQLCFYGPASPLVDNLCSSCDGPIPLSGYGGWRSCFNTGDWIDKLKYIYLDKIQYKILDETQYKWLGGMAFRFESFRWYPYVFPHTHDSHYTSVPYCPVTAPSASSTTIPEPATIGFLGLGGMGLLILRSKRKT